MNTTALASVRLTPEQVAHGESLALAGLKAVASTLDIDYRSEVFSFVTSTFDGFHRAGFLVRGEVAVEVAFPVGEAYASPVVSIDRPLVASR